MAMRPQGKLLDEVPPWSGGRRWPAHVQGCGATRFARGQSPEHQLANDDLEPYFEGQAGGPGPARNRVINAAPHGVPASTVIVSRGQMQQASDPGAPCRVGAAAVNCVAGGGQTSISHEGIVSAVKRRVDSVACQRVPLHDGR